MEFKVIEDWSHDDMCATENQLVKGVSDNDFNGSLGNSNGFLAIEKMHHDPYDIDLTEHKTEVML